MKLAASCLILLSAISAIKSEDKLQRCIHDEKKIIAFTCHKHSKIIMSYSCENRFYADVEHPNYKCYNSKHSTFELNNNTLVVYPEAKELHISFLHIDHLNVNGKFFSETITHIQASLNHLNNIPSSISMPNLKQLDLSFNNFESLNSGNSQSF